MQVARGICPRLTFGRNEPRRVFLQVTLGANWQRNDPHFSVWSCREKCRTHVHHTRATFETLARIRGRFLAEFIEFGLDIRLGHGLERIVPSPRKFDCAILHTFARSIPSHYSGLPTPSLLLQDAFRSDACQSEHDTRTGQHSLCPYRIRCLLKQGEILSGHFDSDRCRPLSHAPSSL